MKMSIHFFIIIFISENLWYSICGGDTLGVNELVQIGTRIKQTRIKKGLKQRELADKADIPYSTLANYENNKREPNQEQIEKIAGVLGVTVYELLGISTDQLLQPLKDETIFLNYLSSIGVEYIPDMDIPYSEYDKSDRAIYWKSKDITIPLTKEEYEIFRNNIQEDVEIELQRLRQYKNISSK